MMSHQQFACRITPAAAETIYRISEQQDWTIGASVERARATLEEKCALEDQKSQLNILRAGNQIIHSLRLTLWGLVMPMWGLARKMVFSRGDWRDSYN